jgi:hypothetical protein
MSTPGEQKRPFMGPQQANYLYGLEGHPPPQGTGYRGYSGGGKGKWDRHWITGGICAFLAFIFGCAALVGLFTEVLPHGKEVLNVVVAVIIAVACAYGARSRLRDPSAAAVSKRNAKAQANLDAKAARSVARRTGQRPQP